MPIDKILRPNINNPVDYNNIFIIRDSAKTPISRPLRLNMKTGTAKLI